MKYSVGPEDHSDSTHPSKLVAEASFPFGLDPLD